jgi:peptidoglycan/LPS O-acetylase OafA/YrhL
MLLMPIFVRVGRANALWLGIALAGTYVAALMCPVFLFAAFFFIGAWLSRFDIRLPLLGAALPQWLGRISYPLYLCHVPLIAFTGLPLWASVPLSFGVAAILTETVEKWSIKASRSRPARLLFSVGHA